MNYKEQIEKLNKEAFEATKNLLKENGTRCCVYIPANNNNDTITISISGEDDFEAIIYDGSFVDDMAGYTCRGVKLKKGGEDPFGEWRTLDIRISNCNGEDYWTDVSALNPLCYADMYEFVKNHIELAMTPEEADELDNDDDESYEEDDEE